MKLFFMILVKKERLQRNDELTFKVKPGSGPKKIIFSPDGQFAYVLTRDLV